MSRPSFDDLADWLKDRSIALPDGRDPEVWEKFFSDIPDAVDGWLNRAGPELARLGFAISAILSPSAIYLGGSLPRSLQQRLVGWLDFSRSALFNGAVTTKPEILLTEISASDSVSVGAAAMMLHQDRPTVDVSTTAKASPPPCGYDLSHWIVGRLSCP